MIFAKYSYHYNDDDNAFRVLDILIRNGTDINMRNYEGKNAFQLTRTVDNPKSKRIRDKLLEIGSER
jgi:hypothetical protein